MLLSLIIPVHNEADNIAPLYEDIVRALQDRAFEVLFADDGSTDGSWDCIVALTRRDDRVGAVRLRRKFGKASALAALVRMARGDVICTLDGDGQDDPAEIQKLLTRLESGFDVVNGWKTPRRDPLLRIIASRGFNRILGLLTGLNLHDHNCGLKVMRAEVLRDFRLYGDMHRFIPVMAHANGFKVTEVPVTHRARRHGRSKYGGWRYLTGLLDVLLVATMTTFHGRPHLMLGGLGLGLHLMGMLGLTYLAGTWVVRIWDPSGYLPITSRPVTMYAIVAVLIGAQTMGMAYLAGLMMALQAPASGDSFRVAETRNVAAAVAAPGDPTITATPKRLPGG